MQPAHRLAAYLFSFTFILILASSPAGARPKTRSFSSESESISRSRSRPRYSRREKEIDLLLYEAITDRLGIPYRSTGVDDRGYDCSGFVWRVFRDAGVNFERGSARRLWATLPEAKDGDEKRFGTLVFFKGLNHVGIVRDAYSFYHVSSSRGVVRSFFSDYWGKRVIGFRRNSTPERMVRVRR